jgi:hypothetical protein
MKYKYMLFSAMLTVIIITIIYVIIVCLSGNETIYVKTLDNYASTKTSAQNKIDKITDTECMNSLTSMLDRIDATYFSSNTTLKKYYEAYFKDNKTFLDYYEDAVTSCNLDESDLTDIYIDVLSSLNYPNQIKQKYVLRYEFAIREKNYRAYFLEDDYIGTYTTKMLEFKVLSNLINEVRK